MLKKTTVSVEENRINEEAELGEIFRSGFKSCDKKMVGVEFEKLPIDKRTNKAASYFQISNFLKLYKKDNWDSICESDCLLGLSSNDGTITLEPGSQTEISLTPRENLSEIALSIKSTSTGSNGNVCLVFKQACPCPFTIPFSK